MPITCKGQRLQHGVVEGAVRGNSVSSASQPRRRDILADSSCRGTNCRARGGFSGRPKFAGKAVVVIGQKDSYEAEAVTISAFVRSLVT